MTGIAHWDHKEKDWRDVHNKLLLTESQEQTDTKTMHSWKHGGQERWCMCRDTDKDKQCEVRHAISRWYQEGMWEWKQQGFIISCCQKKNAKIELKKMKRSPNNWFESRRKSAKGGQVVAFYHRIGRQKASKRDGANLTFRRSKTLWFMSADGQLLYMFLLHITYL